MLPGGRLVLGPYPTHEGVLQCLAACPATQQKGIVKGNNQGTFAVGSLRTARARVRLVDFFLAVEAEGGWPLVTSLYWNACRRLPLRSPLPVHLLLCAASDCSKRGHAVFM